MCKDDKSKIAEMLRAIDKVKRETPYEDTMEYVQYTLGLEKAMQIIMRLRS